MSNFTSFSQKDYLESQYERRFYFSVTVITFSLKKECAVCVKMRPEGDSMTQKNAIVLAAGKGTRMRSEKNKVMHTLIDRPILAYPIDALKEAGADRIVVVAGYQAQSLMDAFKDVEFAIQKEQLGTGHAVMQCTVLENEPGYTLVMNGDVPCLQASTLQALYEETQKNNHSLVLLSAVLEDGAHYGRVVRNDAGQVLEIVESKDCTQDQKQIREINAGVYCFNNRDLFESLSKLTTNNAQHEYYLTDLVKILSSQGKSVQAIQCNPDEMAGINTVTELYGVSQWMIQKINQKWMDQGVQIMDPKRTVIGKDVQIGHDVEIYPGTHLMGKTIIQDWCEIYPNTWIEDATVEDHCKLHSCIVKNCTVPQNTFKENKFIKEGL